MVDTAVRRGPGTWSSAWLTTAPPAARYAFYGDAAARSALLPAWGVEFSEEPCRAHTHGDRATLWLGPDEYLLIDRAEATSLAALEHSLREIPHALVDISHRQFSLEVAGPHAAMILNGACPLDLDADAFPVGMCTRTVLAKAEIVLWRTQPDTFHLEVWRSFAGYVTGILSEIARDFY